MVIFVQKDTIMKSTYMTPEIQVVKVESQLMTPASQMGVSDKTVNSTNATLLGRGGSDWDDED